MKTIMVILLVLNLIKLATSWQELESYEIALCSFAIGVLFIGLINTK